MFFTRDFFVAQVDQIGRYRMGATQERSLLSRQSRRSEMRYADVRLLSGRSKFFQRHYH